METAFQDLVPLADAAFLIQYEAFFRGFHGCFRS